MFNHHSQFLKLITSLLLFIPFTGLADTYTYHAKDYYLINCGLPKSSTQTGGQWQTSDEAFLDALPSTATNNPAPPLGDYPPYTVARIFRAPLTYSFPISLWGPKLVRLYLFPPPPLPPYETINDTMNSFISLDINGFNILGNFSAYQVAANANAKNTTAPVTGRGLVREIYVNVSESDGHTDLKLKFSPSNPDGFGFIYGLEITSVPDDGLLYINQSADNVPYLTGGAFQNYNFRKSLAMENVIRLNVGGKSLQPSEDTGMGRSWHMDNDFLLTFGKWRSFIAYNTSESLINYTASTVAEYTAPVSVYSTMRMIGPYDFADRMKLNLTWGFEVDGGFDYLVRLHFCELDTTITEAGQLKFYISINEYTNPDEYDVFSIANGVNIPIYRDFVTSVDLPDNGSRALLWVAMLPDSRSNYNDVLLNGLEIFKLSSDGSLVARNPTFPRGMIYPQIQNAAPRGKGSNPERRKKFKTTWIHLILIASSVIGLAMIATALYYFRRKLGLQYLLILSKNERRNNNNVEVMLKRYTKHAPRRYTYGEIKQITSHFREKLGEGGYGGVYKGKLYDGALVAVKLLKNPDSEGTEFTNEVASISETNHVNVVSLLGYCFQGRKRALVYDFMPNGSLDKYTYSIGKTWNPLPWQTLHQIAIGIGRGLDYLHQGCRTRILHFDIKPHNILLDANFCPKISDFGLAKPWSGTKSLMTMSGTRGTPGYIAPEVFCRGFGGASHKSDVYSYGMLILDLVGCRKNNVVERGSNEGSEVYFPHWIYKQFQLKEEDHELQGISNVEEKVVQRKMVIVSLWCIQMNPSSRPSISRAVEMLEEELESLEIPPMPTLSSPPKLYPQNSSTNNTIESMTL